jgi:hypothetical protein
MVDSWDEFKRQIKILRGSLSDNHCISKRLLFRGQADAGWSLKTTLDRKGGENMEFAAYYQKIVAAQSKIESITQNRWETPGAPEIYKQGSDFEFLSRPIDSSHPIYSYLTYLRHHGYPTPLLDWSSSLYVASYFAYAADFGAESQPNNVSIYVLIEANVRHRVPEGDPQLTIIGPYVRTHPRHYAQQCEYTLSVVFQNTRWFMAPYEYTVHDNETPEFRDTEFPSNFVICKYDLPRSERKSVLKSLDEHNVNAFTLFGTEESLMESLAFRQFELNC